MDDGSPTKTAQPVAPTIASLQRIVEQQHNSQSDEDGGS